MSIATAPIDARAAAKERFYRAAIWHAADPTCSSAYAEFEDAYEALKALGKEALAEKLALADAGRRKEAA